MSVSFKDLAWEDRTTLALRALYEQYGFGQYRMGKFEPYDLYMENRSFLKSETVITFTDFSGRLMALKPDVTMSIVKNIPPDCPSQKLYYIENVFRMAPGSREYREINQIGLENIGVGDLYSTAETLLLAVKSLDVISGENVLAVGHMGLVSAVLDECGFSSGDRPQALDLIARRNLHELQALTAEKGVAPEKAALLKAVFSIAEPMEAGLERLRSLPLTAEMTAAADELEAICSVLSVAGKARALRLDPALINDLDYYNGVVFRGYIKDIPRSVLSGGRYDNLLRRFGKSQSATGFALYLGELGRAFFEPREYDADILIVYGDAPAERVMRSASDYTGLGLSVRAAREPQSGIRAKKTIYLDGGGAKE